MFRSATFKLTLWYISLIIAISLIFSAVLYQVASNQLAGELDHQSARIYNEFPVFQNNPILRPTADISSGDHRILLRLVLFNLLVIVGAGFGSYALARRTLQPIEEAHEQQKRFTADVSHELRTPLTALKMESEVALMNPEATKQELRRTLESNLEEVNKLDTLINNILRLTRLEVEELKNSFTAVSATKIADAAVRAVEPIAQMRQIAIEQRVSDLAINGDEATLTQLLIIILDNALKYSPSATKINLSTTENERMAIFTITDQGVGIEDEALKHVFDRFYRADASRLKASDEGFGLGLSIAKLIADMHDGNITISSRPKHGTTVRIYLPRITPVK